MAAQIPPWVRPPPDPGQEFLSAFHTGSQVRMEQERLQQQAQMAALDAQVKQQQMEQRAKEQQQQLTVDSAYRQQMMDLKHKELEQTAREVDLKAQTAARKYQAQQGYEKAIQSGMDPTQAMLQFGPGMGAQSSAEAAAIRAANRGVASAPASVEKYAGEDFLMVPGPSGALVPHQIRHAKSAATGTLTQVDRDELHGLQKQIDTLSKAQESDSFGVRAVTVKPDSRDAKSYLARAKKIQDLNKQVEGIRAKARGGTSTGSTRGATHRFVNGKIVPITSGTATEAQPAPEPDTMDEEDTGD